MNSQRARARNQMFRFKLPAKFTPSVAFDQLGRLGEVSYRNSEFWEVPNPGRVYHPFNIQLLKHFHSNMKTFIRLIGGTFWNMSKLSDNLGKTTGYLDVLYYGTKGGAITKNVKSVCPWCSGISGAVSLKARSLIFYYSETFTVFPTLLRKNEVF